LRNEDRRKQTIAQLLGSTKELLQDKGCHAITLKEIMQKSGLSKGAIFHYVKSKDEIFVWILNEHLEKIHASFLATVNHAKVKTFQEPMDIIRLNLTGLEEKENITNKILLYLFGKEEDAPLVSEALQQFHEKSVSYSRQWIELGQEHGVISKSVHAEQMAELFVLLSLGMRIKSSYGSKDTSSLGSNEVSQFIARMLTQQD